jgi:diguanylate cyclase (GGDEF)-like protein/PAS domain S-box-containing protein
MLRNFSLRTILIVCFSALVIVTASSVAVFAFRAGQLAVGTLADQLMKEIGERIDQRLATLLLKPRDIVLSNAALIRQGQLDWQDRSALERHFAVQLGVFGDVGGITLATEQREFRSVERRSAGELILRRFDASTGFRLQRYRAGLSGQPIELIETRDNYNPHSDPPDDPWYQAGMRGGQGKWLLAVVLAQGQDHPDLFSAFFLPFQDEAGAVRGVLGAGTSLSAIGEFLHGLDISTNGQAFVIDRKGLLIATSSGETPFDSRALPDHAQNVAVGNRRLAASASREPVTAATARELAARVPDLADLSSPLSFTFAADNRTYLVKARYLSDASLPTDWRVVVVVPEQDFTDLVLPYLRQSLLLGGMAILIAVLLGLSASRWISRPLRELRAATGRLAQGDFSRPIPPTPIRELQDVGRAFTDMTGRLCTAFAELQSSNAELRRADAELAEHNRLLEQRVAERTLGLQAARTRIEETLAQRSESEAKFRGMFEQSPVGVALLDPASLRPIEVNDRLGQILGRTREDLMNIGWADVTHPDDLPAQNLSLARMQAGDISSATLEKRYLRPDGTTVWAELTVASLTVDGGRRGPYLCLVADITVRKTAETRLLASEQRLRQILEHMPIAIATEDLSGGEQITFVNAQFVQSFGYTLRDVPTINDWFLRAYPDAVYRGVTMQVWNAALQANTGTLGQIESREFRIICRDGSERDVIISACIAGNLLLATFLDITERNQAEQALMIAKEQAEQPNRSLEITNSELHKLSTTDTLTGVWNRRHFRDIVDAAMAQANRYGHPLSLIMFDIDHFKHVNDRHGHLIGDRVLVDLVGRVSTNLREADQLARWGGEEFIVMLPHCNATAAMQAAEKLRALIADRPCSEVGHVTCSFGVAAFRPRETFDTWIKRVDEALYEAKTAGRNVVAWSEAGAGTGIYAGIDLNT